MERKNLILRKDEKKVLVSTGTVRFERNGGFYGVTLRESVAYHVFELYNRVRERYDPEDIMFEISIDSIFKEYIVMEPSSYRIVAFSPYDCLI